MADRFGYAFDESSEYFEIERALTEPRLLRNLNDSRHEHHRADGQREDHHSDGLNAQRDVQQPEVRQACSPAAQAIAIWRPTWGLTASRGHPQPGGESFITR